MTIISFINLKGGVGKTTCCANIAGELARENKKVLVIDGDPQGNLSTMLMGTNRYKNLLDKYTSESELINLTVYQIFLDAIEQEEHKKTFRFEDAVIESVVENSKARAKRGKDILPHLDLLPATYHFMQLESKIVNYVRSRYAILDIALKAIKDEYDFILIDCPPNIYTFTHNALYASDYYIIPTIPDFLSITGMNLLINRLNKTIEIKQEEKSKRVKLLGILINLYDQRLNVHKDTLNTIEQNLALAKNDHSIPQQAKILKPYIRNLNDIKKAAANYMPICVENPRSDSTGEFMRLCKDIMDCIKQDS